MMKDMAAELFDELEQTLREAGAPAAIDRLCMSLREKRDYAGLFYALLLKKRHELGVSPIPTGPSEDLPEAVHAPYEEAIRQAARLVGGLFLQEGNVPSAWAYFRMLGEPGPVAAALEKLRPADVEDVQPLVDIAFYQGVHPQRGFDLVLERSGLCSAITLVGGPEFPHPADVREYCVKRLVRALYAELVERLQIDINRREGREPAEQSVRTLVAGHDGLFGDDFYHIDISHLSAVVQMSVCLPAGEELELARELCEYGQRLSPRFSNPGEPPFEDSYRDYAVYLAALAGERVEEGVAHFRAKVEGADADTAGTWPAEVLVNLLVRLNRPDEALDIARRYLAGAAHRLSCPGIAELCQRSARFRVLAEVAREQGDAVHFLAGLLAAEERPAAAGSP